MKLTAEPVKSLRRNEHGNEKKRWVYHSDLCDLIGSVVSFSFTLKFSWQKGQPFMLLQVFARIARVNFSPFQR